MGIWLNRGKARGERIEGRGEIGGLEVGRQEARGKRTEVRGLTNRAVHR